MNILKKVIFYFVLLFSICLITMFGIKYVKIFMTINETRDTIFVNDNKAIYLIKSLYKNDKYYLYLPTSIDVDNLTVRHSFKDDIYIDGTKIKNGQKTNILKKQGIHELTTNSNTYQLVVIKSYNIYTLFINTKQRRLSYIYEEKNHQNRDSGNLFFIDPFGKKIFYKFEYIKGIGNSTWEAGKRLFNKYPYEIKFNNKISLFGTKKTNKINLIANVFDQSLLRNKFIYDLATDLKIPFTCDSCFADVYVNGEYIGNYLITYTIQDSVTIYDLEKDTKTINEKELYDYKRIKNNKQMCYDVPDNPQNITGGYLLEFETNDRYIKKTSGFVSSKGQHIVIKKPEYASKEQTDYIQNYFNQMEDAVYSKSGYSKEGKYYTEYLDIDSAVKRYIVEELTLNIDALDTSFFLCKDINEKICFGPVWDYDWAIGGYELEENLNTQKLLLTKKKIEETKELNFYGALIKHKDFVKEVKEVWQKEFYPLLLVSLGEKEPFSLNVKSIDDYAKILDSSAKMNFNLYSNILGSTYWNSAYTGDTYSDNIKYLKNFIKKRVSYLNSIWGK